MEQCREPFLFSNIVKTAKLRISFALPARALRQLVSREPPSVTVRAGDGGYQVSTVLLIAHNPGIEDLAVRLARPSPERDDLRAKFPTAALATLELPSTRWSEVEPGCASLIAFVRPRDLEQPPESADDN